jgi:hypothetical protein
MTTLPPNLDERIAAAFRDGAKSGDVADLIQEAEAAVVVAGEAAEVARTRALDPTLSAADVAAARREMEDAAFRRDRLQTATIRLRDRLQEVRAREEDLRRRLAYDEAKAERDQLAAELTRVYPTMEAQLADLLARIKASDERIEHINARGLPSGAERLLVAELVARGLRGFTVNSIDVTRITKQVRLPAFRYSQFEPFAWPPSKI